MIDSGRSGQVAANDGNGNDAIAPAPTRFNALRRVSIKLS
jgi:hypothetical protein